MRRLFANGQTITVNSRFIYLLLILISLPAIFALVKPGYFYTHDGNFHVVRAMQYYYEISHGQFPVRIGTQLAFGYGYPVFNYFYPLLYYLSAALHELGLPFGEGIKLIIALATVGSVLAMYKWLRCHFTTLPASIGAICYLYIPYRFSATYVNGSFGTVLAMFFLPIILLSIYKLIIENNRLYGLLLSASIAGLLLSHNVSALMFFLPVASYTLVLLITIRAKLSQMVFLSFVTLLGIGLASFFVVPALFENKFVKLGYQVIINYREHFPTFKQLVYSKWGYWYSGVGPNDGQSFQIGFGQWAAILLALISFVYQLIRKRRDDLIILVAIFIGLFGLTVFLMLEQSTIIWQTIPVLQQVQFPWRLLAVIAFLSSFLAAWVVTKSNKYVLALLIVCLLAVNNRNYLRTFDTKRYPDSYYQQDSSLYNGSTDVGWENLPVGVEKHPIRFADNLIQSNPYLKAYQQPTNKGQYARYLVVATQPSPLVVNLLNFPIWHVQIDGKPAITTTTPGEGLLSAQIPSGSHDLSIFMQSTSLEHISNIVSVMSGIVFFGLVIFYHLRKGQSLGSTS